MGCRVTGELRPLQLAANAFHEPCLRWRSRSVALSVSTERRQGGSGAETKEVGGIKFASRLLEDVPPRDLKPLADELKAKIGSGVVALIANNEGKGSIVVGVTQDLTDRLSAVDLVRAGSEALGGKGGGGRPDMAQAGGPDGAAGGKALAAIEAALSA